MDTRRRAQRQRLPPLPLLPLLPPEERPDGAELEPDDFPPLPELPPPRFQPPLDPELLGRLDPELVDPELLLREGELVELELLPRGGELLEPELLEPELLEPEPLPQRLPLLPLELSLSSSRDDALGVERPAGGLLVEERPAGGLFHPLPELPLEDEPLGGRLGATLLLGRLLVAGRLPHPLLPLLFGRLGAL
ncbi:hypothetical protein A176_006653 [Myxococcus hansupus]|uniref:Uncharacterized protein n=1 Tax=Pseudomyxococcus hansupus TaxID=1297742 RepID=A0A0H4X250_9BACT|nr:hypothetical protein [Myxococcus hansupus]AKQ69741.1 hypothetical protein A176_006653 [Myxococcus hansupus]